MEFRLLGAIELVAGGRSVNLGPVKQRTLLAALAVDAGRPVTVETLIDRIWDDAPPAEPRKVVHTYIARVRRVLEQAHREYGGPVAVERRADGYQLATDLDRIDLHRFRRLIDQARALDRGDPRRAALLADALRLWRSEALAGLPGDWARRVRQGLQQQRLGGLVDWADAELAQGHPEAVVERLQQELVDHPLAESVSARLIEGLDMAGRQAEALDVYARTRRRIVEELGVEPGPSLRQVYESVLRGEKAPAGVPTPAETAVAPAPTRPAQLPPGVSRFVGRNESLARLDAIANGAGGQPTTVVIFAVWGTAGVGKTALAVHWAQRVADRFPDGQLYVNLRGFDPGGSLVTPAEAVRGFLDAFGVPPSRTPSDLTSQISLYRSLLAGKRVLVVLDNARDAEQVRPLLPGASGCLALVTSRNQLTSLVAAEGAYPFALDLLSSGEARQLLAARLGSDRVAAEPAAIDEIIARCSRLPLALAVVAARAAARPGSLQTFANELLDARRAFDVLHGGDAVTDVRTVFSWSYQTLSPDAARLFRLLGLHPGPDASALAAASLIGAPPDQVRQLLAELTRAHLLVESVLGRYTFHDLLRAYAADLAHTVDDDMERRVVSHRMLDYYVHSAHAAARMLDSTRDPPDLAPLSAGVTAEHPHDYGQALDWLAAEEVVLVAAVNHALAAGIDTHAWQLAWTLYDFLDRQGHWQELVAVQQAAVVATRRLADPPARARAHRNLANAYTRLGRFDEAHGELEHALALCRQSGDTVGQAHTRLNLAYLQVRSDRYADGLNHARQALPLYEAAGHRLGTAEALTKMGWCHVLLGEDREGVANCERALVVFQELGDAMGQANTWDTLGIAHQHLNDREHAVDCYERAGELFRRLGDRYEEATTLARLGDTHHLSGNTDEARGAWRQSLVILADLGHPDAEQVRTKLHSLGAGLMPSKLR